MRFEILLINPAFERITGPFLRNLERLGIDATMRVVDTAQYQNRMDAFDFDMAVSVWGSRSRPATSSVISGPARRPRLPAAAIMPASAIRWSTT
jgi:ABC-type oligopeptide transport system substrate-binding subunit